MSGASSASSDSAREDEGIALVSWNILLSAFDACVLVMYERYTQEDTGETVIMRVRRRALQQLQGGPPSGSAPRPVGFEENLLRRPVKGKGGYGKGKGMPGHYGNFLAIGLPYAKAGGSRAQLCSLLEDVQPTVDRRPELPDGIIVFGLAG